MTQPAYNPAKAFRDARSLVGTFYVNPERNFLTTEEMFSFLEDSCSTCFCDGMCSSQRMMQKNARECQVDAGMCNLSFPSETIKRLKEEGDKVQCSGYEISKDILQRE